MTVVFRREKEMAGGSHFTSPQICISCTVAKLETGRQVNYLLCRDLDNIETVLILHVLHMLYGTGLELEGAPG